MYKQYGLKQDEKITPIKVRNAIIKCFKEAHKNEFELMKKYCNFETDEDFENFKEFDVETLIKKSFSKNNGDFENPTKENLLNVVKDLKEFAINFRKENIIKQHENKMTKLINKLD